MAGESLATRARTNAPSRPLLHSQQALIRGLVKASLFPRLGPLARPQVCKVPALHPGGQLGFIYVDSYLRSARCCSRHR